MTKRNNKTKPPRSRLRVGDVVKVISGSKKDKGKQGRVLDIFRDSGRIRVEGVASIKRHLAPQKDPRHPEGGIVEGAGTVDISNVMLVSEELERPVRIGAAFTDDGKKIRVARGRNLKSVEL
jgi:large subunit ribosomal protein L24